MVHDYLEPDANAPPVLTVHTESPIRRLQGNVLNGIKLRVRLIDGNDLLPVFPCAIVSAVRCRGCRCGNSGLLVEINDLAAQSNGLLLDPRVLTQIVGPRDKILYR